MKYCILYYEIHSWYLKAQNHGILILKGAQKNHSVYCSYINDYVEKKAIKISLFHSETSFIMNTINQFKSTHTSFYLISILALFYILLRTMLLILMYSSIYTQSSSSAFFQNFLFFSLFSPPTTHVHMCVCGVLGINPGLPPMSLAKATTSALLNIK